MLEQRRVVVPLPEVIAPTPAPEAPLTAHGRTPRSTRCSAGSRRRPRPTVMRAPGCLRLLAVRRPKLHPTAARRCRGAPAGGRSGPSASYRRSARRAEELSLGGLTPLYTAIPELAARVSSSSGGVAESSGGSRDWTCLAAVSPPTPNRASTGSDGRIRTFVRGIKILCPAIRRRRIDRAQTSAATSEVQPSGAPGNPPRDA